MTYAAMLSTFYAFILYHMLFLIIPDALFDDVCFRFICLYSCTLYYCLFSGMNKIINTCN